jgi:hypothetical protein
LIKIFSNKSSANIILLFIYGFVLKYKYITSGTLLVVNKNDGILFQYITKHYLTSVNNNALFCNVFAYLLLFFQALQLSNIVSANKFFKNDNYLVGMSYLLITSFLPNFNFLSSALFLNSIILIIWQYSYSIQNTKTPKTLLFNIGIFIGLACFIQEFAVFYIGLVFFMILTHRPFKWNEYLITILGVLVPFYLLMATQFIMDNLQLKNYLFNVEISIPSFKSKQLLFIIIMILLALVLFGFFNVLSNNKRLPIQSRKAWSVAYVITCISVIIALFASNLAHWTQVLLPAATCIGAVFFFIKPIKIASFLHWALIAFVIYVSYFS